VEQVWSRLAGCYGESLVRKFGEEPPPEWRSVIVELNDYQLAQGMRRLKFSGKPHVPSLPEFVKLCRTIGHMDDIPDERPPQAHPALTHETKGDPWEIAGNTRMLGYITRKIPEEPGRYGKRDSDPFRKAILTLVAMKNRWVELMQQVATAEGVPPEEQNQCWNECMRMAEETIAAEKAA
jgi:hypothetical protein